MATKTTLEESPRIDTIPDDRLTVQPDPDKIRALVFDMDGVITRTASIHASAWKQMFDKYYEYRKANDMQLFKPFDKSKDYLLHVDGKPRYDGVRGFLSSRRIPLPKGIPDDEPGFSTICALGNMKNEIFRRLVSEDGVTVYDDAVQAIRTWKNLGYKTAVISASKNCGDILKAAGVESLFDTKVDGVDAERKNIKGKPAPGIFLEATRQLNAEPAETVIFEDAISGIEAGKNGGFAMVVGIARNNSPEELKKHGAGLVIESFIKSAPIASPFDKIPPAGENINSILDVCSSRHVRLFLDYDGTLTPIVKHPEDAILHEDMKVLITSLAEVIHVAIISGRDLKDISKKVGLDNVYYAGSHGFEISGPNNVNYVYEEAEEAIPFLDEAFLELEEKLSDIPGTQIEKKRFAIAVHYRNVETNNVQEVIDTFTGILKKNPSLRKGTGKKVIELQPKMMWDKGKAVEWLNDRLPGKPENACPVYIGDDITDEDAFRQVRTMKGIGILVGDHGDKTYANYSLGTVREVKTFLQNLLIHEQ